MSDYNHKCLVHECKNRMWGGEFVGSLCKPCYLMITTGNDLPSTNFISKLFRERNQLREALECLVVLEEAQETTPHHWEDRALTAERERDEALNVLREINDWINVAAMRPPTPNYAITHGEIKSDQYWRSRNG